MIKLLENIFYTVLISSYLTLSYLTLFPVALSVSNNNSNHLKKANEFGRQLTENITVQRRHINNIVKYFQPTQFIGSHTNLDFNEYSSEIFTVDINRPQKIFNPSQLNFRGPPLS